MNPADHFPQVLSAWENPETGKVDWSAHPSRAAAVEEAGEAEIGEAAHRYLGSLLVTYHPLLGVVSECRLDLLPEAHEYARQSEAEAADRRRRVA